MRYRVLFGTAALVSLGLSTIACYAEDNDGLVMKIRENIASIRVLPIGSSDQQSAAAHLALLSKQVDPQTVDDQTFSEMVSLLDVHDDTVRAWAATSLGNLGQRAKPAIPKLLRLLSQAEPSAGSLTLADVIRYQLKRLGVNPSPSPPPYRDGFNR